MLDRSHILAVVRELEAGRVPQPVRVDRQAVAEGEVDHGRGAVAVAAELACGVDELLDLCRGLVLAGADPGVRSSVGRGMTLVIRARNYRDGLTELSQESASVG